MLYYAIAQNPKLKKLLRKNQNAFRRNRSTTSQILTIRRILEGVSEKPRGNNIIRWLLQGVLLHTQKEDGAYISRQWPTQRERRSHNDAVKITKVKVRSPDGNTDYSTLYLVCYDETH